MSQQKEEVWQGPWGRGLGREGRRRPHFAGLRGETSAGVLSSRRAGCALLGSSRLRSRADPSGATSVREPHHWQGYPRRGSPEVSAQMSSRDPAQDPAGARAPGAQSRSSAFRAHGPGRGGAACQAGSCDSTTPARLRPRVAFRGATAGLQRPGPHFMPEKPMRRLKALCNSSRKILSRDLYLQKA